MAEWLRGATEHKALALAGHLPFLDRLASLLVTGDEEAQVVRFRPGQAGTGRTGRVRSRLGHSVGPGIGEPFVSRRRSDRRFKAETHAIGHRSSMSDHDPGRAIVSTKRLELTRCRTRAVIRHGMDGYAGLKRHPAMPLPACGSIFSLGHLIPTDSCSAA
jgi:hypothetical protein